MLSPNDLGVKTVSWKFKFLGYGATVHPQPGTIFVDLGNKLEAGVIDHHGKDIPYGSSTSAIAANPHLVLSHLLGPINETYYKGFPIARGELQFVFVTHANPDWDGVTALWLCDYLVRNAALPPDSLLSAVCGATDIIDQGFARVEGEVIRPFLIYRMMMDGGTDWGKCLLRGKELIEHLVGKDGRIIKDRFLEPFDPPPAFQDEADRLKMDRQLFDDDMRYAESFKIFVPTHNETTREVDVLSFKRQCRSVLQKYWAREEVKPGVLMVPYHSSGILDRMIISVDPHSDLLLPVLGRRLEQMETSKREELKRERGGMPRFEAEYCDNSNPWYDGRGHGYTIIDSPAAPDGTVLTYEEIVRTVKETYGSRDFSIAKGGQLDAFISYRREGGSDLAWSICNELSHRGRNVFLDVRNLREGRFDEELLANIGRSRNVIVLLTKGALDRCCDPDDWVRREILEAISRGKTIIPVVKEGVSFHSEANLPMEMRSVLLHNRVTLSHEYFYSSIEKILKFLE